MDNKLFFEFLLIIISLSYFVLIVFIFYYDSKIVKDKFSVIKIVSFFAMIESIIMFWFAINVDSIFNIVLREVSEKFISYENVIIAYLFSIISYSFIIFGAIIFSNKKSNVLLSIDRYILNLRYICEKTFFPAFIIFLIAIIIYFIFLMEIGGIKELIINRASRTIFLIGKGGYILLYSNLILFSGLIISIYFLNKKKYIYFLIYFTIIILVEITSGSRYYVILYIFSLYIIYNYKVSEMRSFISIKFLFIGILSIFILLISVYFRNSNLDDKVEISTFIEEHLLKRYLKIERQVTVIGAFNEQHFWYGKTYLSLLDIFLVRSENSIKQPIDTGVYLKALAEGDIILPPLSANELPATSWPEENLSGYMNFGILGYILLCFLSGAILGLSYRLYKKTKSFGSIMLYSVFIFMNTINLSPYGIFNILTIMFFLIIIGAFYKFLKIFNLYK